MRNFIEEFKTFVVRGDAIDLAVGVVIGASFSQITTALTKDIRDRLPRPGDTPSAILSL